MKRIYVFMFGLSLAALIVGCSYICKIPGLGSLCTATATPTDTPTPTMTATDTPTATPTQAPTPAPAPLPSHVRHGK